MLINTFSHIPGIGPSTEKKLWNDGIRTWADALQKPGAAGKKAFAVQKGIHTSMDHLEKKDAKFFEDLLPASQHFRFFPEFRGSCAFLDIETTGLSIGSTITTIALYDGSTIRYYVQGKNLGNFIKDIQQYQVLVTYNGKTFDLPFIQEYFNCRLPHAHIDLRYILKSLGIGGGLKKCEKTLGIDRGELDGVDGYFAVLLWKEYQKTKNPKALDTLLAYNIEDVINLETLMIKAYNLKIKETCFSDTHVIRESPKALNPLRADAHLIKQLKALYSEW
ncbi:MAG: ribonuclease H-like domain-containing protein [Proteobacteria bacterium]|nr:exonuclease [Desulfobacula sp.]MBU4130177.1 ribonuclease H-like domain-containing protein [Pseudomonadota bacterium]